MPKLYLVRHGQAQAGWGEDLDPGLSVIGRGQAKRVAEKIASLGPLEIITSPLARARETAAPLAERWKKRPRLEERVGEIPSPTSNLSERLQWLIPVMAARWPKLGPELHAWRSGVLAALAELASDAVVFTHFIAINVAVGQATGSDRVVSFRPANGSITILEVKKEILAVVELGDQAETKVG